MSCVYSPPLNLMYPQHSVGLLPLSYTPGRPTSPKRMIYPQNLESWSPVAAPSNRLEHPLRHLWPMHTSASSETSPWELHISHTQEHVCSLQISCASTPPTTPDSGWGQPSTLPINDSWPKNEFCMNSICISRDHRFPHRVSSNLHHKPGPGSEVGSLEGDEGI